MIWEDWALCLKNWNFYKGFKSLWRENYQLLMQFERLDGLVKNRFCPYLIDLRKLNVVPDLELGNSPNRDRYHGSTFLTSRLRCSIINSIMSCCLYLFQLTSGV